MSTTTLELDARLSIEYELVSHENMRREPVTDVCILGAHYVVGDRRVEVTLSAEAREMAISEIESDMEAIQALEGAWA